MRINWFSPLPPQRSDIANHTRRIIPVLSQMAEVHLWTDDGSYDREIEAFAQVHIYKSHNMPWKELNYADANIYQIGNDARFHKSIVEVAQKHSGIVIQHDPHVHELALGILKRKNGYERTYLAYLESRYGLQGRKDGEACLRGEMNMDEMSQKYPMMDWCAPRINGLVIHNSVQIDKLSKLTHAPILATPLIYSSKEFLHAYPSRENRDKDRLNMCLFGFIQSPNRRLIPVLEAMASFPEKKKLHLTLAGDIADSKHIKKMIQELGLKKQVEVQGFLSEKDLAKLLDQSDLAINLRWPSRGEASGSLLRIWNHALPCLVTRTEWYAQQPEDCVIHINPENEKKDLHRCWSDALNDRKNLIQIGKNGRKRLESHHLVEDFCQRLIEFIPQTRAHQAEAYKNEFLEIAAKNLTDIEGSDIQETLVHCVDQIL